MERYWISLAPIDSNPINSNSIDPIKAYYDSYNEDSRLLSKHGQVEFLTTMRYIDRYLKPKMRPNLHPQIRILEIGAGTGRYSLSLADRGFQVDAVELMERNIEIFRANIKPEHNIAVRQGNAVDLTFFPDNTFDITLLLGPLYHLFSTEEKRKALSEALRVTKQGGVVFAAYCVADATILQYCFIEGNMDALFEKKLLDPDTFKICSKPGSIFERHRKEGIDELMSVFNVERLHYVATDLYTYYIRDIVDAMDDATFDIYCKYHFTLCERPDMAGLTNHSLDIFRKLD
jgi:SAM-dependent methyltransferase